MKRTRRSSLFFVVLVTMGVAPRARANIAAPWSTGEHAGDPLGASGVAITHEDLVIDMRPIGTGGRVGVSATYELDNSGAARHLDLVFASGGSDLANVRVTLDRSPIESAFVELPLPPSWSAPTTTPAFEGAGALGLTLVGQTSPFGFKLDLPPGRHRLAVEYTAQAMIHHVDDPTVVRQFAYVLAPARTWQSFGGLDVTVRLPRGWRAAVTPSLSREGDVLRGSFPDVPADAIALTTQAPTLLAKAVRLSALAVLAFVALAGGAFVSRRARSRVAAGEPVTAITAIGLGAAWSASLVALGCLALGAPDVVAGTAAADHYGYGEPFAFLALMFGALLAFAYGVARALRQRPPTGSS